MELFLLHKSDGKPRDSELVSSIVVTAFILLNVWLLVVVIIKLCVFSVQVQTHNIK